MGRNRKNITIQLNKRIDALLRIGEKKVKVGGRVDGIHSVKIFMFGVDKADTTRKEFLAMVNENLATYAEHYTEEYCD